MNHSYGTPIRIIGGEHKSLELVQLSGEDAQYNERWIQELIHAHPGCLPIDEIEPGFGELRSVCMELPTRHGPVDNLLLSSEGNIALVEVKLWRNPEARRKAVAQALDYASCIFEFDYADLEKAAKAADWGGSKPPSSLYELFASIASDEARFVDAINTNLRKGRVLIVVAGDGIRTEAARLSSLLQSHAGAHFAFALVELAVYRVPNEDGWLVCPRTMLRTETISGGIVEIDDRRTTISLPAGPSLSSSAKRRPETITAEQFYEAMDEIDSKIPERIREFVASVEPLGVHPEYKGSLNLKWEPPEGKPINLGYIKRSGELWTDAVNWFAPKDLSHQYVEELADAFNAQVERKILKDNWHVRIEGRAPRIKQVADRLDRWIPVIQRFQDRIRQRLIETAN